MGVTDDGKTVQVFVYSHGKFISIFLFIEKDDHDFSSYARISTSGDTITAVMPGDFNYDGKLDLMVVSLNSLKQTTIKVYEQSGTGSFGITLSLTFHSFF